MPQTLPRQRMIEAAGDLLRRHGYAATSMRRIVDAAEAPWGSLHHYFPQGKQQIGEAAIVLSGERYAAEIAQSLADGRTPSAGVRMLFDVAARRLADSDWEEGCPIATTALEVGAQDSVVADACRAAFAHWEALMATAFAGAGATPERAAELASIVLVNLEGALLLSRVAHSATALILAAQTVTDLLDRELLSARS
jgi:TetR/AcrR family transcriptional regulator, lmrAB and yxaGH operons repressor